MIACQINKTLQGAGGIIRLDTTFRFPAHSFTILFGESGAGKTSILRMLAGLMDPESGKITYGDKVWFDSGKAVNLPPQERKVGFVFQDQALFPNMSVRQNLEFATRYPNQNNLINEIIELFELGDLQPLKPLTLSGGQKQKVALARSIINQPDILLLDEPLSALDLRSKNMLQEYIQKIHQEFKLTTVMVSHDLSGIHRIADRVLQLEDGKVNEVNKEFLFSDRQDAVRGSILKEEKSGDKFHLKIELSAEEFLKLKNQLDQDSKINLMP